MEIRVRLSFDFSIRQEMKCAYPEVHAEQVQPDSPDQSPRLFAPRRQSDLNESHENSSSMTWRSLNIWMREMDNSKLKLEQKFTNEQSDFLLTTSNSTGGHKRHKCQIAPPQMTMDILLLRLVRAGPHLPHLQPPTPCYCCCLRKYLQKCIVRTFLDSRNFPRENNLSKPNVP